MQGRPLRRNCVADQVPGLCAMWTKEELVSLRQHRRQEERNPPQMILLVVHAYSDYGPSSGEQVRRSHQRFGLETFYVEFDVCRIEGCKRRIKIHYLHFT